MTADERRTGPPTGHADLDTLADLLAGVLDGPRGRPGPRARGRLPAVRGHARRADAVQGQLRSLPRRRCRPPWPRAWTRSRRPARRPAGIDSLVGRPPVGRTPSAREPEDELARARVRRGRRLSRATGAAAAAVVVLAAGGAIASIVRGGSSTSARPVGTAAGGAAQRPVAPRSRASARRSTALLSNDSGGQRRCPRTTGPACGRRCRRRRTGRHAAAGRDRRPGPAGGLRRQHPRRDAARCAAPSASSTRARPRTWSCSPTAAGSPATW